MIEIYVMDISPLRDRELYGLAYSKLSEDRQRKALRIKRDDERIRSVGASLLLEYVLGKRGVSEFVYSYGKHGKPCLAGREDIRFNISHSGERVMCALSDTPVGCDVERVSAVATGLEKRVLTVREIDIYERLDGREKTFFRFWTAKESFIKAIGEGMSVSLGDIEIFLGESEKRVNPVRFSGNTETGYYVKEYDLSDPYRYACCSTEDSFPETMTVIYVKQIIEEM